MRTQLAIDSTLAVDQWVSVGVGLASQRAWFRGKVAAHAAASGELVLTCFMDRPSDRALEVGTRVTISSSVRGADRLQTAEADVLASDVGAQARVRLRVASAWQIEDERRQQARVPLQMTVSRARRWSAGAWRDLAATVTDLSSRGVGLRVRQPVQLGERVSLALPFEDGQPDLRVTIELRHVHAVASGGEWRAGGLFRQLSAEDHERVVRYVFAELRSRLADPL